MQDFLNFLNEAFFNDEPLLTHAEALALDAKNGAGDDAGTRSFCPGNQHVVEYHPAPPLNWDE